MAYALTRTYEIATEYRACRSCGTVGMRTVLDLGEHAVSDFYREIPVDEARAPLRLVECRRCGLVQLSHSVDKDRLYRNYWYQSGINEKMVVALNDVIEEARQWTALKPGDTVLDIGANDGTLLNAYPADIQTIGYDPSNIEVIMSRHVVRREYYPPAGDMVSAKAKIITSIAMFYDVDEPVPFVRRVKYDLHPEGVWICQMMDLEAMIRKSAFDNICHEHTVYWSVENFAILCRLNGLQVVGVSRNAVNGGSVRFVVKHYETEPWIVMTPETVKKGIEAFAQQAEQRKYDTVAFLRRLKKVGRTVLGYGASTKGNTLLQWYGIGPELLPAIAERHPDKVGCVTAGMHIPIISESEMRARRPDYLFILPWAFVDSFVQREAEIRALGTRFIVPLPDLGVI